MKALFCYFSLLTLGFTMTVRALPDPIKQTLARSGVGANNELLASPEDQRVLYGFVKQSWRDFLPELNAQSLTAQETQLLIQASIEALPDSDYLPFVVTALRLLSEDELPASLGVLVIMPSKSDKEGFLAMNYQEADLASALASALPKFIDNPQLQVFVEQILSGTAKQRHIQWMKEQGLQVRPPVNAVADSVAAVPSATTFTAKAPTPLPTANLESAAADADKPKPSPAQTNALPWPWIIGAILFLAVVGGILLKLLRK
jgi:hypothetical protein